MAAWGYSQGLIVGALSLAGFVGGALLGARLAPRLLEAGSHSPYAPLVALAGALLIGVLLASTLEVLGLGLRARLGGGLGMLDGVGGAVLACCLGLTLAWVVGAVALQTPGVGELREPIQRSSILAALNERLPPSGPILRALARFDPFPRVQGPAPGVGPPDAAIARDPDVAAASRSVVKVLGTACGLGVQGSGWIARDGVVVTNAHVVAGQDDTAVELGGGGARLDAEAILFDPANDLALLRVPALRGRPALRLHVDSRPGSAGAILGFPENGPYDVRPGRLGQTETVVTQDAYGRGPVRRRITAVRGLVRPGNSGGPMVDASGRVVATLFATATGGGDEGFAVPDSVVRDALSGPLAPVDTGPCAR